MHVGRLTGVTLLAAGAWHSCAVVDGGQVMCWGTNVTSELGNGSSGGEEAIPGQVINLRDVTAMASHRRFTCAVVGGNGVECWGSNNSGQLGNGSTTNSQVPVQVILSAGS